MQEKQLSPVRRPRDDTRWVRTAVGFRLVVVVGLLAPLSRSIAGRPGYLSAIAATVAVAAIIVLAHTPTGRKSWAGLQRNLGRTGRTLGLRLPVSRSGEQARWPALVGWLVLAPAAAAYLLWWYANGVLAVVPAPSGAEVAANAQRAQSAAAYGVTGAITTAFLKAALPEELLVPVVGHRRAPVPDR